MTLRSLWLPANGAAHGALLDRLLVWNLAAVVGLFLLAHLLFLFAMAKQGRRKDTALEPEAAIAEPSARALLPRPWPAEWLPLIACCVLFAAMAIGSERLWARLRYQGPAPAALQVEVVGAQFQWYFRYPGPDARFGATRPQLVDAAAGNPLGLDPDDPSSGDDLVSSVLTLPAGREVDLRLRAHDVIHGFFIPGMRLKQNAVPGLELHVHFTPTAEGDYPILCTQVCGSGHPRMQAVLHVISPDAYAIWLKQHEAARARQATWLSAPAGRDSGDRR